MGKGKGRRGRFDRGRGSTGGDRGGRDTGWDDRAAGEIGQLWWLSSSRWSGVKGEYIEVGGWALDLLGKVERAGEGEGASAVMGEKIELEG